MSVLIFVDHSEGKIKKVSKEAAWYGAQIAAATGTEARAVALGSIDASELSALGAYGIKTVHHAADARFDTFDTKSYAKAVSAAADAAAADVVVISANQNGKSLAPRVSIRMEAGLVAGATQLPETGGGFKIRKTVFSGKAFADYSVATARKVIGLVPNSVQPVAADGTADVQAFSPAMDDSDFSTTQLRLEKVSGDIPLTEAELVVSGGRGLKGPENWGMIEELAGHLGAATACSRAVADVDWRPHHEHVGQTGVTIRPNLYIAIAISGAIQHLAGVNSSKVIVVINNDPEAPFFKAADYGIVGDAFEVIPKLNEAMARFKASAN